MKKYILITLFLSGCNKLVQTVDNELTTQVETFVHELPVQELPEMMRENLGISRNTAMSKFKVYEVQRVFIAEPFGAKTPTNKIEDISKLPSAYHVFLRNDQGQIITVQADIDSSGTHKIVKLFGFTRGFDIAKASVSFGNECGIYSLGRIDGTDMPPAFKTWFNNVGAPGVYIEILELNGISYVRIKDNNWATLEELKLALETKKFDLKKAFNPDQILIKVNEVLK